MIEIPTVGANGGDAWTIEDQIDEYRFTVAEVGPLEYHPGENYEVEIPRIPYSAKGNYFVVVKVRDERNEAVRVTHYGQSEQFSFSPDQDETVEVQIPISVPIPDRNGGALVQLLFDWQERDTVNNEGLERTSIFMRVAGAKWALISSDIGFQHNAHKKSLFGFQDADIHCYECMADPCPTAPAPGQSPWIDCIADGFELTGGDTMAEEGEYSVFVQFLDENGFSSSIYQSSVNLDNTAPSVSVARLEPAIVAAGESASLYLVASEELDWPQGPTLRIDSGDTVVQLEIEGPEQFGSASSFRWTLSPGVDLAGSTLHFVVDLVDRLRAAAVVGSTPRALRRRYVDQFRNDELQFLVNCEVFTRGFDAPGVRVVVLARPTRSHIMYEQMIGRGLRGARMGGTEWCTVYDVVDNVGTFGLGIKSFAHEGLPWNCRCWRSRRGKT